MAAVRTLVDRAVLSHWITARHFAPMMVEANRGLIVEVTDGEARRLSRPAALRLRQGVGEPPGLRHGLGPGAHRRHRAGALAGLPALRGDAGAVRRRPRPTGATARASDPDFAFSETPHFIGRAIAALAADPQVRRKAGAALFVGDLADEYGFTDLDGTRPHFPRSTGALLDAELAKDGPLEPLGRPSTRPTATCGATSTPPPPTKPAASPPASAGHGSARACGRSASRAAKAAPSLSYRLRHPQNSCEAELSGTYFPQ